MYILRYIKMLHGVISIEEEQAINFLLKQIKKIKSPPHVKILLAYYPQSKQKEKALLDKSGITTLLPLKKFSFTESKFRWKILILEDGTKGIGKSPTESRQTLQQNQRGLKIIEGVYLQLLYPEVILDHSCDLLDARYSIECIPTIYKWKNFICLSAICPDVRDSMCGAPIVYCEKNLKATASIKKNTDELITWIQDSLLT